MEDQGGDDGIGSNNNHQLPSNNNINKPIPTVKEMFYQRRKIEKEKFNDIPRKFKGFESLLDEDEDENIYYDAPPLPTGSYTYSTSAYMYVCYYYYNPLYGGIRSIQL